MDPAIRHLERSVMRANAHLNHIARKMDLFDQEVLELVETEEGKETVLNLLDSVIQVKEDYRKLRHEMAEVQKLEKAVRIALHQKTRETQLVIHILRQKLKKRNE